MNKEDVIELVDSEAIFYDGFDDAIGYSYTSGFVFHKTCV